MTNDEQEYYRKQIRKWIDENQQRVDQIVHNVRLNRILVANGIDRIKLE